MSVMVEDDAATVEGHIPNTPEGWPQKKIRDTFVGYFKSQQHTHWPSSSVVPHEDPTLLFANAGMNQYKSIFLGASPARPLFFSPREERAGGLQSYLTYSDSIHGENKHTT